MIVCTCITYCVLIRNINMYRYILGTYYEEQQATHVNNAYQNELDIHEQ